ncbi:MAG: hypothetical protein C0475_04865 [Planctomyces sp.]|nr:hypothetical protein [Planctomyces sp.]
MNTPAPSPTPAPAGSPETVLGQLGIELPPPNPAVAAYIPTRRVGSLLWVSGQLPMRQGQLTHTGRVGEGVSAEDAKAAARQAAVGVLAAIKAATGSLDSVRQFVRVGVWVACDGAFTQHSQVANGASDLLVQVFGEAGRHARAAVGAPSLPLGAPVEVEALVELR